jgi:hypothetical protein
MVFKQFTLVEMQLKICLIVRTSNNLESVDLLPWSLTLREERRLRVFENRVLRGIFGSKRYEVV